MTWDYPKFHIMCSTKIIYSFLSTNAFRNINNVFLIILSNSSASDGKHPDGITFFIDLTWINLSNTAMRVPVDNHGMYYSTRISCMRDKATKLLETTCFGQCIYIGKRSLVASRVLVCTSSHYSQSFLRLSSTWEKSCTSRLASAATRSELR